MRLRPLPVEMTTRGQSIVSSAFTKSSREPWQVLFLMAKQFRLLLCLYQVASASLYTSGSEAIAHAIADTA
jgi:hypothetical protein